MKKFLSICLCVLFLSSCGAEQEYTSWPCRFTFDNSLHLDETLNTATNSYAPGIFCKITQDSRGGQRFLKFENNQGLTSEVWLTAAETYSNMRIGLNNGIIVGFTDFDGFAAYDIQCPNCVRESNNYSSPNFQIVMDTKGSGLATCSKCSRVYSLRNSGLVVEGKEGDKGLERYRNAYTAGPNQLIRVVSE